ncbi:hypothetical protein PG999_005632 [Apiospora kogelbergensis]|uniref:Ankyrin repeat-containing protein n=1 Tax=Apiospora kogelbergensis TaxID=1337665 RepID=A0AAW0R2N2_9PEZI
MGCFSRFRPRLKSKRERDRRQQGLMAPPVAPDSAGPQSLSSARPSGTDTHLPPIVTHTTLTVPADLRPDTIETTPTGANGGSSPTSNPNHDAPTIPDIWAKAYGDFVKREPELATDFKKHLATISDAAAADATGSLSPDRARSIVEQLQKKREEEQWHITFYGKDVKFRAQAEKLAKFFLWCNDIVKGALSAQPYAALAWSGVSILLPLLTSGDAQHEAMLLGFDSIHRALVYWQAYQDAFPEEVCGTDAARDGLVELYSHIFEFQARVICHLSSAQLARAWQKVAGWNDWEKKASYVTDLNNHCRLRTDITRAKKAQWTCNQQLQQMDKSRTVLEHIYGLLERERNQRRSDRDDQRERELLANLAVDHEAYKNFNPPKVKGTCAWFLEDANFREWHDSTESSLLWVSAGPGCGKSVLSRSLIDDWQLSTSATTSAVCYFFFKDGDGEREHSYDALSAIIHQLFIRDLTGKFTNHAFGEHKNYGKKLRTTFTELWNVLLKCATTPDAGEIICVLDALDECREDERNIIIGKLLDLREDDRNRVSKHLKAMKNRTYLWLKLTFDIIQQQPSYYSRPSDLDNLLKKLPDRHAAQYETLLDTSHNEMYTDLLLQIVLAATRPLSLDEARYTLALAAGQRKPDKHSVVTRDLWEMDAFKRNYWPHHYRKQGDSQTLLEEARNLCRLTKGGREWMRVHNRLNRWNWANWTDLALAAYFGLAAVVRATVTTPDTVINADCGYFGTALQAASAAGFSDVVEALLDHGANINTNVGNYGTPILAAVHNGHTRVVSVLLEKRGEQVKITQEVVVAAAGNPFSGKEIMALLLEKRGEQVKITQEVVVAAAGNPFSGKEIMALLLEKRGEQVKITQKVVVAAAGNKDSGKEIMALLLEKRGEQVKITQKVVVAAAGNEDSGKEIMALLLEKRGEQVEITQEVVVAAARNQGSGKVIMA